MHAENIRDSLDILDSSGAKNSEESPSSTAAEPELITKNIDDSLNISLDSCGKLHAKNIEASSTATTASSLPKNTDDLLDILPDGCSTKNIYLTTACSLGLTAKNIDDSLDILIDASDSAVMRVNSIDSGRSSCQSDGVSPLSVPYDKSASVSPACLTTSAQFGPTMSTSSSFNDFHANCFSSDGRSLC